MKQLPPPPPVSADLFELLFALVEIPNPDGSQIIPFTSPSLSPNPPS